MNSRMLLLIMPMLIFADAAAQKKDFVGFDNATFQEEVVVDNNNPKTELKDPNGWSYGLEISNDYAAIPTEDFNDDLASSDEFDLERSATSRYGVILLRRNKKTTSPEEFRQIIDDIQGAKRVYPVVQEGDSHKALIDEFVVNFNPELTDPEIDAILENAGATTKKKNQFVENQPLEKFRVKQRLIEFDGLSPQEGLQRLEDLKNHPSVLHAAPNTLLITPKQVVPGPQFDPQEISFFAPSPLVPVSWPNDAYYKFGHQKPEFAQINAPDAWEYTIGGCNVKIAIVDDGIDVNHNDLKDKILASYDAYYDDNDPQPSKDDAHGMASAGVAAAITNNSTGVAGTIWGGKIIPIRIFDSDGSYVTTPYILQNGLLAAVELDADVLSNSWGFSPGVGAGQDFIIVNNAIDTAIAAGKVLVFSVGNGTTNVEWPASLSTNKDLIAVGAIGTDDKILTTSKWMPVGTVTLAAPGASINTTDISGPDGWNTDQGTAGDYYHTFADTSAAAPFVAGAAALLLSWAPGTQPATIRDWLALGVTAPSDPLESHKYGAGILNIAHSIELAGTSNTLLTITAAPMVRLWSGRETFIRVNVQRNGQPLSGVRVTFESENTLLAQIVSDDETVPTDCDGVAQVRVRGVSGSMTQDTTDIKAKLANLEQSVTITVGGLSMIEMLALLLGLLLSLATWKFFKRRRGA